jgi:hypothetical protein
LLSIKHGFNSKEDERYDELLLNSQSGSVSGEGRELIASLMRLA